MAETWDLWRRIAGRDPVLLARLISGDPATCDVVLRFLRLCRLDVLKAQPAALVSVLAAHPDALGVVRSSWEAQDPTFTRQVVAWVSQHELRVQRAAA